MCGWIICHGSGLGVRVGGSWGRSTSVSRSRKAKFRNDVKTLTRSWTMSWMPSLLLSPFEKWRNSTPNPFILKCSLCTWGVSPYSWGYFVTPNLFILKCSLCMCGVSPYSWGYFLHLPSGSPDQCPLLSIFKTLLHQLVPLSSVSSVSNPRYWLISFVSFSIFHFVWPLNSNVPQIPPLICFLTCSLWFASGLHWLSMF